MCRTISAVVGTVICTVQTVIRLFMTVLLMLENIIRMVLQSIYNLISFIVQLISILPLCLVFVITSRCKMWCCGPCSGGPCPSRSPVCDCLMSMVAIAILVYVLYVTGVLDKMLYQVGYAKFATSKSTQLPTEPVDDVGSTDDIEDDTNEETTGEDHTTSGLNRSATVHPTKAPPADPPSKMCQLIRAVFCPFIATLVYAIQMVNRLIVAALSMIERLIRMFLQAIYNILACICQMIMIMPICCIFILTSRMKCLICNSGNCNKSTLSDCFWTLTAIVALFLVFHFTGLLDKILYLISNSGSNPRFSQLLGFRRKYESLNVSQEVTTLDSEEFNSTVDYDLEVPAG